MPTYIVSNEIDFITINSGLVGNPIQIANNLNFYFQSIFNKSSNNITKDQIFMKKNMFMNNVVIDRQGTQKI